MPWAALANGEEGGRRELHFAGLWAGNCKSDTKRSFPPGSTLARKPGARPGRMPARTIRTALRPGIAHPAHRVRPGGGAQQPLPVQGISQGADRAARHQAGLRPTASKLPCVIRHMLGSGELCRDREIDCEKLMVMRNAPRGFTMLKKHGLPAACRAGRHASGRHQRHAAAS